jgi:hypothetical protein
MADTTKFNVSSNHPALGVAPSSDRNITTAVMTTLSNMMLSNLFQPNLEGEGKHE